MDRPKINSIISVLMISFLCLKFGAAQNLDIPDDVPRRAVKAYEKGRDFHKERAFNKALEQYQKAVEIAPDFAAARIMYGSLYYDRKDYGLAIEQFQNVVDSDQPFPNKLHLTLGLAYYEEDDYAQAVLHLSQFLEKEQSNKDLIRKAKKHLKNARFAKEAVAHPIEVSMTRLGDGINTSFNEYMPSITADGKRMIYSRRVNGYELLFESVLKDGVWQEGQPIDRINEVFEGGAHSISADGRFMVFTSCDRRHGYGSCDLFYSRYTRGEWTHPRNMGLPINSSAWDAQPALADNGRTLYFSSNRKGSIGGKDLWVTHRLADDSWSIPINLGRSINTPKDEKTPFLHFDGKTMYFMGNGYPGMGDFDLYRSERIQDTLWTEPVNLGYPLNTKYQEGALIWSLSGDKAYMTSDRHHSDQLDNNEKNQSETDIYEVILPKELGPSPSTYVEFQVRDAKTKESLTANIDLFNTASQKSAVRISTQGDGYELVCLPLGQRYAVQVYKDGYDFYSERWNFDEVRGATDPILVEVFLQRTEEMENERPIVLKNILFESGSAVLLEEARAELDFLISWMLGHPNKKVEIHGHTDNVGDAADNLSLSQRRAQAVVDVLVESGVTSDRIKAKGFGETMPIADNETPEGRALNRRTEFLIKK